MGTPLSDRFELIVKLPQARVLIHRYAPGFFSGVRRIRLLPVAAELLTVTDDPVIVTCPTALPVNCIRPSTLSAVPLSQCARTPIPLTLLPMTETPFGF